MTSHDAPITHQEYSFQIGGKPFDGLDWIINPRESHALVGIIGSGKSSLDYMTLGCEGYSPTGGEILFEGRSINVLHCKDCRSLLFPACPEGGTYHGCDDRNRFGRRTSLCQGHYHGPLGGVTVLPSARVRINPHGRYISDFSLSWGRVGKLRIDYAVNVDAYAVAELTAKVFGHAEDEIEIREEALLSGENARSLIKT